LDLTTKIQENEHFAGFYYRQDNGVVFEEGDISRWAPTDPFTNVRSELGNTTTSGEFTNDEYLVVQGRWDAKSQLNLML
jgi:hypothetical protein